MSNKINVAVNGERLTCPAGMTLAEIIKNEKPCGGHGKCGKCKVIVKGNISDPCETELGLLSKDELSRGIRLACLTYAYGDCEIETIAESKNAQIVTAGATPNFELNASFRDFGVAIDIGTTTIAARLYDVHGNMPAEASCLNSQSTWGADVISRIEASLDGKASALASSVRADINNIIEKLAASAKIDARNIQSVVITGNTVMLCMLTGQDVKPFSHAPFVTERFFGEMLTARELGLSALHPDTQIYLPPCISAFVGADTVCALLATKLCEHNTAMLVDIGTNGEMALWHDGHLTVCSTAAGPAFEGVGISMGMRGETGAIDKVTFVDGKLNAHVIGECNPLGICGSGLVDAVAYMLDAEILDETGLMEYEPFMIKAPVRLIQSDIRMLQLAKSAICAGLLTLTENAELDTSDIPILYIAGGFGSYLNPQNAAKIGLLPASLANNSQTVGNAALGGASMLLLDADMRVIASQLASAADTLELSTNPIFSEHYMLGMMFEET